MRTRPERNQCIFGDRQQASVDLFFASMNFWIRAQVHNRIGISGFGLL